jgi:hypothetical protein
VPLRLVFESALELMSCTQVGTFQVDTFANLQCVCWLWRMLDRMTPENGHQHTDHALLTCRWTQAASRRGHHQWSRRSDCKSVHV